MHLYRFNQSKKTKRLFIYKMNSFSFLLNIIYPLVSLVLILVDKISTTNTKTINPQRIAPTFSQLNAFIANINGAPIPPAPTKPNTDASFILISNLFRHFNFTIKNCKIRDYFINNLCLCLK